MTLSEMIHPGDKVEIRLLQEVRQMGRSGENVKVYLSKVLDVDDGGGIEIAMPMEEGTLVMLALGVRYEFIFAGKAGMYQAVGQIRQRYKKDNIYMLLVELRSQPEKFQRREFFRYTKQIKVFYYPITEEEADMESGNAVFIKIQKSNGDRQEKPGQLLDISGGGGRLQTDEAFGDESYVLIGVHLKSETINKQYYIPSKVIKCVPDKEKKKYELHVKFLFKDTKTSEEIIKYIFEKERMERQRGVR